MAIVSKIELRAMIKKFLLSDFENLPDPSAILIGILREAL